MKRDMIGSRRRLIYWVMMVIGCLMVGCSEQEWGTSEREDEDFQKGQQLCREGRSEEAMVAFRKVIGKMVEAPEAHLEIGRLYLDYTKDPISAIYHFRQFLELRPNVEQAPMVKQMVETAKKEFVKTLPQRTYEDEVSRVDLMALLKQAREENMALKKQLAGYREQIKQVKSGKPVAAVSMVSPMPVGKKEVKGQIKEGGKGGQELFYTVEAGDTLSKISYKVYGTTAHWEKVFTANTDQLRTPHDLKVGQVLRVPQINR